MYGCPAYDLTQKHSSFVDTTSLLGRGLSGDGVDQSTLIQRPVISDNQDRLEAFGVSSSVRPAKIVSASHDPLPGHHDQGDADLLRKYVELRLLLSYSLEAISKK